MGVEIFCWKSKRMEYEKKNITRNYEYFSRITRFDLDEH